jgi:hypothetical protein
MMGSRRRRLVSSMTRRPIVLSTAAAVRAMAAAAGQPVEVWGKKAWNKITIDQRWVGAV